MRRFLFVLLALFVFAGCGSDTDGGFEKSGVYGTIKSASGEPIVGASVVLFSNSGACAEFKTDSKGRYFTGKSALPEDDYFVYITAKGFVSQPFLWHKPPVVHCCNENSEHNFTLAPLPSDIQTGAIKVSVSKQSDEEPLACSLVVAKTVSYSITLGSGFCITNKNGECTVYGLEPADYEVWGLYPGLTVKRSSNPITVEESSTAEFATQAIDGYTGAISASLRFDDFVKPQSVELRIFTETGIMLPWFGAVANETNSAQFDDVPVGSYLVLPPAEADHLVVDPTGDRYCAYARVSKEQTTELTINLQFKISVLTPQNFAVVPLPSEQTPFEVSWDEWAGIDGYALELVDVFSGKTVWGGFDRLVPKQFFETPNATITELPEVDAGVYQLLVYAVKRKNNNTYNTVMQSEYDSGFVIFVNGGSR